MAPTIGMMMSPTSEVTMPPKAAPMMTPTARSTTLPFIANSRNSFSTRNPLSSTSRTGRLMTVTEGSVEQARMHHGIADHLGRRRRHRHQRQTHFLLDPAEQLEAMLGAREARLLENGVVQ